MYRGFEALFSRFLIIVFIVINKQLPKKSKSANQNATSKGE